MKKRYLLLAFGIMALVCGSCKKDEPEPVDLGYDHFPRKVGAWIEYEVDSIIRDDSFSVNDTVSYHLLEKVVETYTDPAGRQAWRIHRFVGPGDGTWTFRDVWTSTMDAFYAEVAEENMRRLKLSFPVRVGRTWDSNVYNTEGELTVAYEELDQPWSAMGLSFASTALVVNTVPANIIERNEFVERYAKNVGLVYRQREVASIQTATGYVGWKWTMTAVDYGQD